MKALIGEQKYIFSWSNRDQMLFKRDQNLAVMTKTVAGNGAAFFRKSSY